MIALLLALPAFATTGLAWQWPEAGWRYHLAARVHVPPLIELLASNNYGFRAQQFQIELVTTCTAASPDGKSGWNVVCKLDDVSIQALPVVSVSPESVPIVLEEIDGKLSAASVQLRFGSNGRIKNVDLEGIERQNQRQGEIQETLRLVLVRVFASLDLEFPSKGDDKGKGSWKDDGLLSMGYPSDQGSMGSLVVVHTIEKEDAGIVTIRSEGGGTLLAGEMINVNGVERPVGQWSMTGTGVARFDTGKGVLLEREYLIDGQPTASSFAASGTAGQPYVQAARAVLITGEAPVLPASGVLSAN